MTNDCVFTDMSVISNSNFHTDELVWLCKVRQNKRGMMKRKKLPTDIEKNNRFKLFANQEEAPCVLRNTQKSFISFSYKGYAPFAVLELVNDFLLKDIHTLFAKVQFSCPSVEQAIERNRDLTGNPSYIQHIIAFDLNKNELISLLKQFQSKEIQDVAEFASHIVSIQPDKDSLGWQIWWNNKSLTPEDIEKELSNINYSSVFVKYENGKFVNRLSNDSVKSLSPV